jgi:para-nitrobenzyl esterase
MSSYWANFVKTGDPNGKGLPEWPKSDAQNGYQILHLNGKGTHATPDDTRARYEFLDAQANKQTASGATK